MEIIGSLSVSNSILFNNLIVVIVAVLDCGLKAEAIVLEKLKSNDSELGDQDVHSGSGKTQRKGNSSADCTCSKERVIKME